MLIILLQVSADLVRLSPSYEHLKVNKSTFIILKCQHLIENNIILGSLEGTAIAAIMIMTITLVL